jgi:hypothetical protein
VSAVIAARGGGDRPARRIAGHLDAVAVVEVVVLSGGAIEQHSFAGGNAGVAGAGRGGDFGQRVGTVRVACVGGDPDQERYGERRGGPRVVRAHTAHDARSGADGRAAGTQQVNGLPDVIPPREVLPGDFVEQESVLGLGAEGTHYRPHVEPPAHERGQIRPVRQRPAHRERRIGSPLTHGTPPHRRAGRSRSCPGGGPARPAWQPTALSPLGKHGAGLSGADRADR